MVRDIEQSELIDLGAVSAQTLGAEGELTDFVRAIPKTGISED